MGGELYEKEAPIKEHGEKMERLEKENFELKMQINHLRGLMSDPKEANLDTVHMSCMRCASAEKSPEGEMTKRLLSEAHAAMEALVRDKRDLQEERKALISRVQRAEEEKEDLLMDCRKLSEHVTEKEKVEGENIQIVAELKAAMLKMREGMERAQKGMVEKEKMAKAYEKVKEEYVRLEGLYRAMEKEYREDQEKRREVTDDYKTLCVKYKEARASEEARARQIAELEKSKLLGERIIEELKREKGEAVKEVEEMRKKAESIIHSRDSEVYALRRGLARKREEMRSVIGCIGEIEKIIEDNIRTSTDTSMKLFGLNSKLFEIESAGKELVGMRNRLAQENGQMAEERERLLGEKRRLLTERERLMEDSKEREVARREREAIRKEKEGILREREELAAENSRLRKENQNLLSENRDVLARLKITPEILSKIREMGINEFTSLNDIIGRMYKERDRGLGALEQKIEALEGEKKEEKRNRRAKIEEFQSKFEMAVEDLNACKEYLARKKEEIKMLRREKRREGLLGSIEVSRIK